MSDELLHYERLFASAFASRDPARVLREAAADPSTPEVLRTALATIDEDGVRLSGLIVTRLRFERLIQGSRRAAEWFESDPRAFSNAFKRYQDADLPRSAFPAEEGAAFELWLDEDPAARTTT